MEKKVRKKANKAKARKVVKALVKNDMSQTKAAKDLGVSQAAVADHIAYNPEVKKGLQAYLKVLEDAGANDKLSAKVISEAMKAEKTVSVEDDRKKSKGVKGPKPYTKVTEEDHAIRLKANEQYLKIKRLVGSAEEEKQPDRHIHLHFGDKNTYELIENITNRIPSIGKRKPDLSKGDSD